MATPVPDRSRKLIAINAFYHADQPEGSITVVMEGGDLWEIANFVSETISNFKRDSISATSAMEFLDQVHSTKVDSATKLMMMATIGYLEDIGAIPTDNFNGMQYLYESLVTTEYLHVEGPMPHLEIFRDLPRQPGNFYFVLAWTDIDGRPCDRRIVRQMSLDKLEVGYQQFQDLLNDQYLTHCEAAGETDKERFIVSEVARIAERAVELLEQVTSEEEFRVDSPVGRLACFIACWIVWTGYRDEIKDSLLTLAFLIGFENGRFEPFIMADHGEEPQPATRH